MIGRRALIATAAALPLLRVPNALATVDAGWVPLFDGRTLDGWDFYQDCVGHSDVHRAVTVEKGMLHFLGPHYQSEKTTSGWIATKRTYRDYHLRLQFAWGERRYAPRALQRRNSGILYHMGFEPDRLFPPGVEFQIEESDVGDAIMIDTLSLHGPLLGGTPLWPTYFEGLPRKYEEPIRAGGIARQWHRHAGAYERLDGWNTLDLIAFGDQAAHLVNGRIVNTLFQMAIPGKDGALLPLTEGRIALEFEQAEVSFRNIGIRALSADDIARIRSQGSY